MNRASRRVLPGLLWIGLVGTCAVAAELPDTWRNWRYIRPIAVPTVAEPGLVRVTLPLGVASHAQATFADVRVIDAAGHEVPYVLQARLGHRSLDWRRAELSEAGFVPGRYTQVVADSGPDGDAHNIVEVQVADGDFFTWVEVAAEESPGTWRIVRDRAPLYRFAKDGLEGTRTISFPETRARRLRLRLLSGDAQPEVRQIRIGREQAEPAELDPLPTSAVRDTAAEPGTSRWQAEFDTPAAAVGGIRVETERAEFHRPVRVRVSDDGETWRVAARSEIYRYAADPRRDDRGPAGREQFEIRFAEVRGRFCDVTVYDRNDAPIDDFRVRLLATPRHVVFSARPGGVYRLIYGNPRAAPPVYELARLARREDLDRAPGVDLGPPQENEGYVSSAPWTERHPAVLWGALVVAIVVLGGLALRALRDRSS